MGIFSNWKQSELVCMIKKKVKQISLLYKKWQILNQFSANLKSETQFSKSLKAKILFLFRILEDALPVPIFF